MRRLVQKLAPVLLTGLLLTGSVAGCAGVPTVSDPQAIGTVERPAPSNLPKPTPGMDPDVLLREFLKATADPANRHLAARQFLTQAASDAWDDAGGSLLIDHVVFVETRAAERVTATMRADILGSLSDGVFETAEGVLPDPGPIELVKTTGGWRINRLPNGVFLDWQQFQATYKRNTLYFADPTGRTVVPDPRYVAVADHDQLATELLSKLLAGPRPAMAHTVRNLLAAPMRLRGPVTRADGGKSGVGRNYGGARVDLEKLSTTDPRSRQLLAAQIIWTLARADIGGPYVINADGAPLDDRFADGWTTSDVAATDPGVADGAGTGLHALVNGSLVGLDGQQHVANVPGAFGRVGDQTSAALSRNGREVASVVTLHRGAPDQAASLWIGELGGEAVQAAEGHTLSRPSWSLDDAVWVVVDASNVMRAIQEPASGQPARIPVDSTAVATRFPGPITDLQLSRDGTRAAMVIGGQVIIAGVEQTQAGQFALTNPRRLGFGLATSVVSLSWRTGDDIVVTRTDPAHPVSYVNIDGVNSDAPSPGLQTPLTAIAANPSTVYVAAPQGVLQYSASAEGRQVWSAVPGLTVPGAQPVLPG